MEGLLFYCVLTLAALVSVYSDIIEIPAYEYLTRFQSPLSLGQCPNRIVPYPQGAASERCTYPNRKGHVTHKHKRVHSKKNMVIVNAEQLFRYIRLCDDKSAAYFGLLSKGDCLASEIAKKLAFKDKHVIRMYVEHFRPRVDRLVPTVNLNIPTEFTLYLNNTYYTENIGIGTEEIILVEMQFKEITHAIKAQSHQNSVIMSDNLEYIAKHISVPKKLKVIRMSSSDQELEVQVFRGQSSYQDGLAYVKKCERKLQQVRHELMSRRRDSHLKYGFRAYEIPRGPIAQPISSISEQDKRENWQNVTLLQVNARREYVTYKRFRKFCRKPKSLRHKFCPIIKDSLRKLRQIDTGVHTKRRDWSQLDFDYQRKFIVHGQRVVKSLRTRLQVSTKALRRSLRGRKQRKG